MTQVRYVLAIDQTVFHGVSMKDIASIEDAIASNASHVTFTCEGPIHLITLAGASIGWAQVPESDDAP
jgi:hypothetical protein